MTDQLVHRGPDGYGHAIAQMSEDYFAALGHRRLSIIDLSGGHQPMHSHDDRFRIAYNGEIYNFIELRDELIQRGAQFRTASDTEVILEAWREWGAESLTMLRGMFAFALYDAKHREMTLARDPFGKKPLYISETTRSGVPFLVFGSEIPALLRHPNVPSELDVSALYDFLLWRYVPGPRTFFSGIRKLEAGSYMTIDANSRTQKKYWLPPEMRTSELDAPKKGEELEAFREVFDEAVRLRLRSDVPVGAFLSGGLDSSSVVATLAHLGAPEIRTYSVGFRDDATSELPLAEATAKHFGTIHTPVELEANQLIDLMPDMSRLRGAPITEPADLPIYEMSREASRNVKVVLSGEGADEMFAGYPKHQIETYLAGVLPSPITALLGRSLLAITSFQKDRFRRHRIAARALTHSRFSERMPIWFGALTNDNRSSIWKGGTPERYSDITLIESENAVSPLRRVLHFDQTSWLPDNLLERMDRMTMAASVEARTPFMDTKLSEFASSLPQRWRLNGFKTKYIVRAALSSRLPETVIHRPKNGFRLPVAHWFRNRLADELTEMLSSSDSVMGNFVDRKQVEILTQEHASGDQNHEKTLWMFYALEVFLREFFSKRA